MNDDHSLTADQVIRMRTLELAIGVDTSKDPQVTAIVQNATAFYAFMATKPDTTPV